MCEINDLAKKKKMSKHGKIKDEKRNKKSRKNSRKMKRYITE